MKQKWIALTLVLVFAISLALPAHAAENTELEQTIIDACTYGEEVSLIGYNLDSDDLNDLFYGLLYSGRLPWYTESKYTYSYMEDTGLVTKFTPAIMAEALYIQGHYEQKLAEILQETVFDGMSQWQIALSIHDYLIANSAYDETDTYREGYDLLTRGTSVCNGYAKAYMDLMNLAGIPTVMVTSDEMDHGWNLVCIDGNWYHVDVTWDDPTSNLQGRVEHTYFLLTDEEIRSADDPHYGWETDITCTDTQFQDSFWKGVTSRICYADGNTSYLLRTEDYTNYIYSRDEFTGKETLLYTDEKQGLDIGQGSYYYPHRGLSLWDGRLYFSTPTAIRSMNLDGSDVRTEFSYDAAGNGKYIYGSFVKNDTVYMTLRDHDDTVRVDQTISLDSTGYHVHSFTAAVTAPTCTEAGYILHTCSCGLTCQSNPTKTVDHTYEETVIKEGSFFSDGESEFTCTGCGDSFTSYSEGFDFIAWAFENETRGTAVIGVSIWLVAWLFGKIFKKKKVVVK